MGKQQRKPGVEHFAKCKYLEINYTTNLSTWEQNWRGKPGASTLYGKIRKITWHWVLYFHALLWEGRLRKVFPMGERLAREILPYKSS